MKVVCKRLLDESTGPPISSSSWLSVGTEYLVLSVHTNDNGKTKFQVIGDDGSTPALHCAEQFEVTSDLIPSNWCVVFEVGSSFELTPRPWRVEGFWEHYFDGEPEAIAMFDAELEQMNREEAGLSTS